MTQRILGVVELQVDPEVLVLQVQLAPVPIIPVLHPDDRLAEVGQLEQEAFLDPLELATLDLVRLVLVVVAEAEMETTAKPVIPESRTRS